MPPLGDDKIVERLTVTPRRARERSSLARIDYSDAFLVGRRNAPDRAAEQWARDMLEGAPLIQRLGLVVGWTALGLRLHSSRSTRFVLGWEVRHRTLDVLLIAAGSRFGVSGELLFERQPDALLFSTFVQLTNPVARIVWAAVTPLHRWIVRHLLTRSAQRD